MPHLKKSLIYLLAVGWLLVWHGSLAAQSGRKSEKSPAVTAVTAPSQDEDVIGHVRTSEIVLPVTVRNEYGRLSHSLSASDFIVVEDGVRQTITSFNQRRVPLRIVILLDVSGSIFSEMEAIRQAGADFVKTLSPGDAACVIQFGKGVEVLQDWTDDAAKVATAIQWKYRPTRDNYSETHLWDALASAAHDKLAQVEGRRTILLLTDGDDNQSRTLDKQAMRAVLEADSTLYVVSKARAIAENIKRQYGGFGGLVVGTKWEADKIYKRLLADEARMDDMATRSGGKLLSPLKTEDLAPAFREIGAELQSQYVLTYVSSNEDKAAFFRSISVIVTRPGLKATSRSGYFSK
ncbi:MAG: VWA domain-containing protein [Blastocatellia bacterium]|nr:VWA domain-containing protein [Blastocatellia bacterium]